MKPKWPKKNLQKQGRISTKFRGGGENFLAGQNIYPWSMIGIAFLVDFFFLVAFLVEFFFSLFFLFSFINSHLSNSFKTFTTKKTCFQVGSNKTTKKILLECWQWETKEQENLLITRKRNCNVSQTNYCCCLTSQANCIRIHLVLGGWIRLSFDRIRNPVLNYSLNNF